MIKMPSLRKLLLISIPVWNGVRSLHERFHVLPPYGQWRRVIEWTLGLLMKVVAFLVNIWAVSRISGSYRETCTPGEFLILCWLKSIIQCAVIDLAFESLWRFLSGKRPIENMERLLIFTAVMWTLLPECARVVWAIFILALSILVAEALVDQFIAWKRSYDPVPVITLPVGTYWEVIAILRSSNNGFDSRQLYSAMVCDLHELDDPFWPSNVSTVCMAEVRRRNSIWITVTLWRVSLLNGGKKRLHEFNCFTTVPDGRLFARRVKTHNHNRSPTRPKCFHSNGVVFFPFCNDSRQMLFVYDMRFRKSAVFYPPALPLPLNFAESVTCLRRLFRADRTVEGWKIQILIQGWRRCNCHDVQENRWRPCLINEVIELRNNDVRFISEEDILFRSCHNLADQITISGRVRTSNGSFGLRIWNVQENSDQTMLYNPLSGRFTFFPNFQSLLRSDRPLATCFYTPSPWNPLRNGGERGICPAILNQNECVYCIKKGAIYRTQFNAPSLRYATVKSLFRIRPQLRQEITAEEFRRLTGVGGMENHFDR